MSAARDRVLNEVVRLAGELPLALSKALAAAMANVPIDGSADERRAVLNVLPHSHYRAEATTLVDTWIAAGAAVIPAEIAVALDTAALTVDAHRQSQRLELVWTGPTLESVPPRRTDQALLQVIAAAHRTLTIVSFAAYKVPRVAEALLDAARRGVEIRLILEDADVSAGKVTFDALNALGPEVAAQSRVYVWPLDQRPKDARGRHGSLHAKLALADDTHLLVSSANLTEHAFMLNIEAGVLVSGGAVARQANGLIDQMISRGVVTEIRSDTNRPQVPPRPKAEVSGAPDFTLHLEVGRDLPIWREPFFPKRTKKKLQSAHGEDVRTWNTIYGRWALRSRLADLGLVQSLDGAPPATISGAIAPYFWGFHPGGGRLGGLDETLAAMENYRDGRGEGQKTEFDVLLVGREDLVCIEAKNEAEFGRCSRYDGKECPELHLTGRKRDYCQYWHADRPASIPDLLTFGDRPTAAPDAAEPLCARHYQLMRNLVVGQALADRLCLRLHAWAVIQAGSWNHCGGRWSEFKASVRNLELHARLRIVTWEALEARNPRPV